MTAVLATVRSDVAGYLDTLIWVYSSLILLYILTQWLFSFGLRPPYYRWSDVALRFLRETCEPYLRIFRRFLPSFGGFDFSPMIALIVLRVAGTLVANAING